MFTTRISRSFSIRLATLVVVGLALLAFNAGSANALANDSVIGTDYLFNFGNALDSGKLRVSAGCSRYTHQGYVSLSFQTPYSTPGGLWVYTIVRVKNHASTWAAGSLLLDQRQQWVQTVYKTSNYPDPYTGTWVYGNTVKSILGLNFNGAAGNAYDVSVEFYVAQYGGPWSPAFYLQPSQYSVAVDRYGNTIYPTSCYT